MKQEHEPVAVKPAPDLAESGMVEAAPDSGMRPVATDALSPLTKQERVESVLGLVSRYVLELSRAERPRFDANATWQELGIFGRAAREFSALLSSELGHLFSPALLFDYPTPRSLARHLSAALSGERAEVELPFPERCLLHDEPIAIVGMGCRYPGGVRSPDELWALVREERDAMSELPSNRGWNLSEIYDAEPGKPGKTYAQQGAFLHDADAFDAGFFGIGPREARALDPQQRLLLETSWEAVERAGIDPCSLRATRTGVYVGIAYQDYGPNWHESPPDLSGQLLMGSLTSAASGRIAYSLGLEGPALTIDTACSSSLAALHLACNALRAGECSLALAGGATVMATPGVFLEFASKRGLSADGRCKSFSADADGTGWGEGAGVLLLERLSDARRNGHPVLALVRGSALNQDGASNGLTAPNGPAQQRVILQALANAGLSAADVDAVDAHGTGTVLGDPIEAQALLATYGCARPADGPLELGSLKSNIGHTQAAAAVGSVIKMVMAMQHRILPKTLHVTAPSPHVDWSKGAVSLLLESKPWVRGAGPRRCGVSAFGVSGTNGHVILEEAPRESLAAPGISNALDPFSGESSNDEAILPPWHLRSLPCVLSAKTESALRAQAGALVAGFAQRPDWQLHNVAASLSARSNFKHRAVIFASERETAIDALRALERGITPAGAFRSVTHPDPKLALLFSGQGSQRPGMGHVLYTAFPEFAAAFDEVCAEFEKHAFDSLSTIVFAAEGSPHSESLDQTQYTQVSLFALEVALYRLTRAWGLTPAFLIGHSIGELVAAHVAGVFSLSDACKLVAARARLMQACRGSGAMVAIEASEAEVADSLVDFAGELDIAAVNGPRSTVVAGHGAAAVVLAEQWRARGRKVKRLRVSHAFHSPHMNEMLPAFRAVAETIRYSPPTIPIVSNLTGLVAAAHELTDPEYWVRHVRDTVRFLDGVRTLEEKGVTAFLELGPDAVLSALVPNCLSDSAAERAVFMAAQRPARPQVESLTAALAELHVHGIDVTWRAAFRGRGTTQLELPTYPFERQRYWLECSSRPSEQAPSTSIVPAAPSQARSALGHYRVEWKAIPEAIHALSGTWLLFAPETKERDFGLLGWLSAGLASRGARARLITLTGELDRDRMQAELRDALAAQGAPAGILSLFALDESQHSLYPGISRGFAHTVALAQALEAIGATAPLWCLSQGAVSVDASDPLRSPAQAMAWGLGRVLGLEQPRRWGGLVDVPEVLDERALRNLCAVLASRDGEDQVAVRRDGVFVRRLVTTDGERRTPPWQPRGTTLITGGTGAIGAHAARWLARNGAEHLALVSRRGDSAPGAKELAAELTELGASVTIVACDVADRARVAELLAALEGAPPLRAVVHAAGVSGKLAPLGTLSLADVASIIAAKVSGALNLHELLSDHPLDAFVLLSSIAGVWGAAGQGLYAAANAWLDALAEHRRARGLPACAIAWGPWAEDGMAVDAGMEKHLHRAGLSSIAPELATPELWRAVAENAPTTTIADVDWERFAAMFTSARASHFFDELPVLRAAANEGDRALPLQAFPAVKALSGPGLSAALMDLVRGEAAEVLGHAGANDVDVDARFLDMGFDSLACVDLRKRLSAATGLRLAPSVVFDHPTPQELALHLERELASTDPSARTPPPSPAAREASHSNRASGERTLDGAIRHLYRDACDRGLLEAGFELLQAAAKLRPKRAWV